MSNFCNQGNSWLVIGKLKNFIKNLTSFVFRLFTLNLSDLSIYFSQEKNFSCRYCDCSTLFHVASSCYHDFILSSVLLWLSYSLLFLIMLLMFYLRAGLCLFHAFRLYSNLIICQRGDLNSLNFFNSIWQFIDYLFFFF